MASPNSGHLSSARPPMRRPSPPRMRQPTPRPLVHSTSPTTSPQAAGTQDPPGKEKRKAPDVKRSKASAAKRFKSPLAASMCVKSSGIKLMLSPKFVFSSPVQDSTSLGRRLCPACAWCGRPMASQG